MKIKYAPILYLKKGEVDAIVEMKTCEGFCPIIISSLEEEEPNQKYLSNISNKCSSFFITENVNSKGIPIIENINDNTPYKEVCCFVCDASELLKINFIDSFENIILCIDFQFLDGEKFQHISNRILSNQKFCDGLNKNWHSVIISSSSYPETRSISKGEGFFARYEIQLYKEIQKLRSDIIYSDRGTQNPILYSFQPPMKPAAKIGYSLPDKYYVHKGEGWQNDPHQFIDMAKSLINKEFFMGQDFSQGDSRIEKIAKEELGPGNLVTWKSISMNHHFELTMKML